MRGDPVSDNFYMLVEEKEKKKKAEKFQRVKT